MTLHMNPSSLILAPAIFGGKPYSSPPRTFLAFRRPDRPGHGEEPAGKPGCNADPAAHGRRNGSAALAKMALWRGEG